jgi:hypothetical protein
MEEKKTECECYLSKMHHAGALNASFLRSDKSVKFGSFNALLYKSAG